MSTTTPALSPTTTPTTTPTYPPFTTDDLTRLTQDIAERLTSHPLPPALPTQPHQPHARRWFVSTERRLTYLHDDARSIVCEDGQHIRLTVIPHSPSHPPRLAVDLYQPLLRRPGAPGHSDDVATRYEREQAAGRIASADLGGITPSVYTWTATPTQLQIVFSGCDEHLLAACTTVGGQPSTATLAARVFRRLTKMLPAYAEGCKTYWSRVLRASTALQEARGTLHHLASIVAGPQTPHMALTMTGLSMSTALPRGVVLRARTVPDDVPSSPTTDITLSNLPLDVAEQVLSVLAEALDLETAHRGLTHAPSVLSDEEKVKHRPWTSHYGRCDDAHADAAHTHGCYVIDENPFDGTYVAHDPRETRADRSNK